VLDIGCWWLAHQVPGEFEERLKKIMDETPFRWECDFVIDEVHP